MGRGPGGRNGRRCRRRTTHSDGTAPPALPKPHQHQYRHTGGAAKNILSERLANRSLIVSALSEQGFLLYLRNAGHRRHGCGKPQNAGAPAAFRLGSPNLQKDVSTAGRPLYQGTIATANPKWISGAPRRQHSLSRLAHQGVYATGNKGAEASLPGPRGRKRPGRTPLHRPKIGRASCRERVELPVVAERRKQKK